MNVNTNENIQGRKICQSKDNAVENIQGRGENECKTNENIQGRKIWQSILATQATARERRNSQFSSQVDDSQFLAIYAN